MMSDPEKWEEIFKYTIDQTSPDQERKEQMWNRLQSTISGRGQKRKQVIRSGWQPHGRKTFAAALAGTCVIAVCLLTGVGVNAATMVHYWILSGNFADFRYSRRKRQTKD